MRLSYGVIFTMLLIWIPAQVSAQALSCAALLQEALAASAERCEGVDGGNACVGAGLIESSLSDTTLTFAESGDQIALADVTTMTTPSGDLDTASYSVARLELDDEITTSITLLGAGTLAWDERSARPYQGLVYTLSPAAATACAEAPNTLIIATADNQAIDFLLNDAELVIAGQVAFNWQNQNSLTATVIDGTLSILDGADVVAGQTISAVTLNEGNILFWSAPRPNEADESALIQAANDLSIAFGGDPAPEIVANEPAPDACLSDASHTVADGETLFIIGQQYEVTVDQLVAANDIADRDFIVTGQTLALPCEAEAATVVDAEPTTELAETAIVEEVPDDAPTVTVTTAQGCNPTTHLVASGDNVFRLAMAYNTSIDAITQANDLPSPQQIVVGQELMIPCV